ncbi:MAG: hypothetical protein ACTS73_05720 [Arsenophonus sp. NEOnobi-MAG3]
MFKVKVGGRSGNRICFNSSLLPPYLKHAKISKSCYHGCVFYPTARSSP